MTWLGRKSKFLSRITNFFKESLFLQVSFLIWWCWVRNSRVWTSWYWYLRNFYANLRRSVFKAWRRGWGRISKYPKISNNRAALITVYSVSHNFIAPSKELCSKMAQGEVGVSLPWWCQALVLPPPGYWGLFLNLIFFCNGKMTS